MPSKAASLQLNAIIRAVRQFPAGASVSELLDDVTLHLPRRTLQRRLETLVTDGHLIMEGQTRSLRYRLPGGSTVKEDSPEYGSQTVEWISTAGRQIQAQLSRPLTQRTPVGYQRQFLGAYEPNTTFYLSAELRRELAQFGQVGFADLPAGTYLRQIMDRLLIDLSWNSSRLEGNTYSLLETERLLELGENAAGKNPRDTQMILNHKAAIEMLAEQADEIGFNRYSVCNLHALLADNLLPDPAAGGRVRSRPVGISGTVFHPLSVPQQIEELFDEILIKAAAILDPFEQSFFVMVHLPYLLPFDDVNKRVSRLAANIPLVHYNLCPLSFIDVEQQDYIGALLGVYELNRIEYLRDVFAQAYRRSCARYAIVRQALGEPDPFRLRYRGDIGDLVREVVQEGMSKKTAADWLARAVAARAPQEDAGRLLTVVETELGCLHVGNIARYRLRPAAFEGWQAHWK